MLAFSGRICCRAGDPWSGVVSSARYYSQSLTRRDATILGEPEPRVMGLLPRAHYRRNNSASSATEAEGPTTASPNSPVVRANFDALESISVHLDGFVYLPLRVHRGAPHLSGFWR